MFKPRETSHDRYIRENLRPRSLSLGQFIEIHISSLRDTSITLLIPFKLSKGGTLSTGTKISGIIKTTGGIHLGSKNQTQGMDMVLFRANNQEHIISEAEFSLMIKRCFDTTQILCFSLRDKDRPDSIERKK